MGRFFVVGAALLSVTVFAFEPLNVTEDEFKMFQHYKAALADARVQAMKPEVRVPAIAKDAGYKLKELQKAIERAEASTDLKARCESNLREAFAKSELGGRIERLEADLTGAQGVIYVQWLNEERGALPIEASFAAAKAIDACAIASTVTVWANDKAAPKSRVFQALISSASARRINVDKVKDFAETRYLKLFEKVKNAANGDDLSDGT